MDPILGVQKIFSGRDGTGDHWRNRDSDGDGRDRVAGHVGEVKVDVFVDLTARFSNARKAEEEDIEQDQD